MQDAGLIPFQVLASGTRNVGLYAELERGLEEMAARYRPGNWTG